MLPNLADVRFKKHISLTSLDTAALPIRGAKAEARETQLSNTITKSCMVTDFLF